MATITASPRLLKEAKYQAVLTATKIKAAFTRQQLKSWTDVTRLFHITVPENFSSLPWSWGNLSLFTRYWENSFEQRLSAATESKIIAPKIHVVKATTTFGTVTLFPEQQGCFESIYTALFDGANKTTSPFNTINAALQDGYMGSGKTYIAVALIARMIKSGFLEHPDNFWRPHPFIILTPKAVAESWRRVIESFGLSEYLSKKKILVMEDTSFSTDGGRLFVDEHEDDITGDVTLLWNPVMVPVFCVVDECHRYINPKSYRTRCLKALIDAKPNKRFLFMSATPMEKVNDSYIFTLSLKTRFMDMAVNEATFKMFAGLLDARPDKPNREAVKRLRQVLSPYIFSIPYVKPKHKAVNVVQLVDFKDYKDQQIYQSAHERYIEACQKSGKNTLWGQFEKFIALNNYRKTVEPLRAYYISEHCQRNYHGKTKATAVFCAFKETIIQVAFTLIDVHGIPRDRISIVWGGKREYKSDELLSQAELDDVLKTTDIQKLLANKVLIKRVRTTLRYLQDRHEHSESIEEQATRHNRLKELKLIGKQSDNARQTEIDKFQSGESVIALATLASGGVGLSFDRDKEHLLQREGLFTPVYSGKEFQQALGRLVRRASLSDALQMILMMRHTVEESHVAPILDEKLKCIAEITNRNFDIIELLLNRAEPTKHVEVRDITTAEKDADADDTIVADFHKDDEEEEDEEDENVIPVS